MLPCGSSLLGSLEALVVPSPVATADCSRDGEMRGSLDAEGLRRCMVK
jgi:hypothetical protein